MKKCQPFLAYLTIFLFITFTPLPSYAFGATIPNVPINLKATAVSSSVINLSWDPVTDAATYTVYRSSSPAGTYASIGTVSTNSYSDSGLLASTTYYYKVKASNSYGSSNFSAYVYATTWDQMPGVPKNLIATAASSKEIKLTWDPVIGAASYIVSRSDSENGTYTGIATTVKEAFYSDTGLTANKTYFYKVQAANSKGTSDYSNTASVTTLAAPSIPPAPTGLTAKTINSSTIGLAWGLVTEATSYYVYRATSSTGTYSNVATVTTNSYSDTALLASTTYYYMVKANNESGSSNYSSMVYAKTSYPTGVPNAPASLNAVDSGSNSIYLTWSPAVDATAYYLYRATSSTGTYTKIATVEATSFTDTGLTTNQTYYYKVKAYNSFGLSAYSERAYATASPPQGIPGAPENLGAVAISYNSIRLEWDRVDNAAYYYLYRATSSSGTYNMIATVYSESYTDTGLSANTRYYYLVQAHNSYGTSNYSPVAYATTYYTGSYSSDVNRLAGQNRYETAARIALEGWISSYYAVIASGEDFPDALCGTPLAGRYNAPILLNSRYTLESQTRYALSNLNVQEVFIIGGTGVISAAVEQDIENMGINVTRIAGNDRYETSVKVAKKLGYASKAVIATGEDFPDAISIAPIAAMNGYPILLTNKDQLPDVVKTYLRDNIQGTVVVGGTGVVGSYVYNQLPSPIRLSGYDRYETNLNIVKTYVYNLDFKTCYVATGEDFPDALAGSALAAHNRSPVILVSSTVNASTTSFLNSQGVIDYIAFGGPSVVSDAVMRSLEASTPLSAPQNLSATGLGSNVIYLNWSPVLGADSYYVYRATSPSGTYTRIDTVTTSYYYDANLTDNRTYYYKVKAHNSSGTSGYSSVVYATTH